MFSLARGRNTRVSEQITWKEGSLDQEEQGLGGRGEMWPLLGWLEFHGPGMVGVWEVGSGGDSCWETSGKGQD